MCSKKEPARGQKVPMFAAVTWALQCRKFRRPTWAVSRELSLLGEEQ